ncbi:hypothetical protein BCF46_3027 [Litoreibacter meonggei]|uniref:Uncharacterized protein n=1 Tax=Litoreibacter meonggei TaxID=1049199 RepID=A0A497VT92_9RHOB|nr:hypothetical protein BCF46_3027 [Litoreibacter meonggei]
MYELRHKGDAIFESGGQLGFLRKENLVAVEIEHTHFFRRDLAPSYTAIDKWLTLSNSYSSPNFNRSSVDQIDVLRVL